MGYVLDANVFITAQRQHYGFDICPGFWNWLEYAHSNGLVHSIEAVYDEIAPFGDDLAEWVNGRRSMFVPLDAAGVESVAAINRWATNSPDYEPSAKAEFAAAADSFLLAHARGGNHTLVTHETISDAKKRIPIPNAAAANGVRVTNPFRMLRAEGASFVLGDLGRLN